MAAVVLCVALIESYMRIPTDFRSLVVSLCPSASLSLSLSFPVYLSASLFCLVVCPSFPLIVSFRIL